MLNLKLDKLLINRLDLSVNFTDCNQNRRRRMKILQGDFDAKPFFK
ncbi:MAG: hypothetical protein LBR79_02435 [Oscillospiraceae bacterium]|nr:hypothetical protein [Oscillospiraceae bacterium]